LTTSNPFGSLLTDYDTKEKESQMTESRPSAREVNVGRFMVVYGRVLREMVEADPKAFAWPASQAPVVAENMGRAFLTKSYNHDGKAMKKTCKELGIKHTRKAMEAFFERGETV
jgi:hypothetical protein